MVMRPMSFWADLIANDPEFARSFAGRYISKVANIEIQIEEPAWKVGQVDRVHDEWDVQGGKDQKVSSNPTTMLFLVNDDVKAVRVAYEDAGRNKETLKKTFMTDLKVGDYVLVETDTRWHATVVKIVAVNVEVDIDCTEKLGWVFSRVDMAALDELRAEEEKILSIIREAEKREAKEAIKAKIMRQCGDELRQLPHFKTIDAEPEEAPTT